MSESALNVLEGRVTRLETDYRELKILITEGFGRIENTLAREISELKTEQLSDLKEANKRLADDQRRLWERLNAAELRENQRIGSSKAIGNIGNFIAVIFGGVVTWIATYLSSGGRPHP